jgi:hypothetical protein
MLIVAGYLYWPVMYVAIYRPFILPRLSSWSHIPLTIVAALALGYIALLLAAGRRQKHARIVLHALGIAVVTEAFLLLVGWLQAPGFVKALEMAFDPWEALVTAVHAIVVLACLEAGRALVHAAKPRGVPASHPSSRRNAA